MVLAKAAEMGMDIQSRAFWEMRPDNFITMYIGYRKKQQEEMYATRRLMFIIAATTGEIVPEHKLLPLPLVDGDLSLLEDKKEAEFEKQKAKYTPEYIAKQEEEHRKRMEIYNAKKKK